MPVVELTKTTPAITTITLNRPERLNAMSFELVAGLHSALDEVANDADCKVVVLTGAGRGFCAGLDLREYGAVPGLGEHPQINKAIDGQAFMSNLTVHLRQTPQVVVAAVNGVAFGGGLLGEAVGSTLTLAIVVGLVVGKLAGITGATLLAVRRGWGVLPAGVTRRELVGLGALAGIGFTVSLFIAELAFEDEALVAEAKVGIFAGSLISGVLGAGLLMRARPR